MSAMSNLYTEIHEYWCDGYSVREISQKMNLPESFVSSAFNQTPITGTYPITPKFMEPQETPELQSYC